MRKLIKHKEKLRALSVLTLFLIGVYFINSFAQTYTVVAYHEERKQWQQDIERQLHNQGKELKLDIKTKYSIIQSDFTRYRLQQNSRLSAIEERLEKLENQLNE